MSTELLVAAKLTRSLARSHLGQQPGFWTRAPTLGDQCAFAFEIEYVLLMDPDEDRRPVSPEPNIATAVPDLSEVFFTPYTKEDVARGVRAKQNISTGVLVEVAHCIRIPQEEYEHHLRYSVLEHYLYVGRNGDMLLALGAGSLFNHSEQPNLNYTIDHDRLVIRYRAARTIAAQEELTITYGSSSKLWFEDTSASSIESSRSDMLHEYLDDEDAFLGRLQVENGKF